MKKINKKSGFTLIELLAVIGVLSLLLVLALPRVVKMIDDAQVKSNKASVQIIVKTAEKFYVSNRNNESINDKFDGSTNVLGYLKFTGEHPSFGSVKINEDGEVFASLIFNGYRFVKEFDNDEISYFALDGSEGDSPFEFEFTKNSNYNVTADGYVYFQFGRNNDFFTMDDLIGGKYFYYEITPSSNSLGMIVADLNEKNINAGQKYISLEESGQVEGMSITATYDDIFEVCEFTSASGNYTCDRYLNDVSKPGKGRIIRFNSGHLIIIEDNDALKNLNKYGNSGYNFEHVGSYFFPEQRESVLLNPDFSISIQWKYTDANPAPSDVELKGLLMSATNN